MVAGNQGVNFETWGALSDDPSSVVGFANHAIIELRGRSELIEVEGFDSSPANPSGSNTLTIIR